MKKTGWAILLALCCIGGYLVLPSNYYLRRALIHLLPKIDQYPIFENRTIDTFLMNPSSIAHPIASETMLLAMENE